MTNPYHSEVAQANKKGGSGHKEHRANAQPGTPMKLANWPGLPGKAGPNRAQGYPKAHVHPQSKGL